MSNIERHRDGRRDPSHRTPSSGPSIPRRVATLSALAACAAANAGVIDINGGSSWGGWTNMGNSRTAGMWTQGSTTRDYNVYSTLFTLEAAQTVGGMRLADGAPGNGTGYTGHTQASLFSGSWQAGDSILGVGLQYTGAARLATIWVHVDWAGDSLFAAPSVGTGGGTYQANAGDLSIYSLGGNASERFQSKQYSMFTAQSDGSSNFITPYGMHASVASPVRSFAVLASGSGSLATSGQYFINLDAIRRSNGGASFGEGLLGASTKVGFMEADANWDLTQQVFTLPAPGAMALCGVAMLAPLGRRTRNRRRSAAIPEERT